MVPVGALDQPDGAAVAFAPTSAPTRGSARAARASRAGRPGGPSRRTGRSQTRPRTALRARDRGPPRASRATPCRCGCGRRARARAAAAAAGARTRRAGRAPARPGAAAGSSAEILTETFVRGIAPALSRSSTSRAGQPRCARASSVSASSQRAAYRSASGWVTVASPSRSTELVTPRFQRSRSTPSADAGVSPTMNRCAMCFTPAAAAAPIAVRRGSVVGHPHRRGQRRRGVGDLAQELPQVAGEIVERPAGGGDVDEPEQRGLELLIGRCEIHRPLVERPERMAGARRERRGEVGADLVDRAFERWAPGRRCLLARHRFRRGC